MNEEIYAAALKSEGHKPKLPPSPNYNKGSKRELTIDRVLNTIRHRGCVGLRTISQTLNQNPITVGVHISALLGRGDIVVAKYHRTGNRFTKMYDLASRAKPATPPDTVRPSRKKGISLPDAPMALQGAW